jgi:phosphoenolpyruvate-protein kinase (PTS system EI component)
MAARETVAQARARADKAEADLEAFKEKVQEVALQYAEDHGWCGVVEEALEEVGIKPKPKAATITVTVTDLKALFDRWDYVIVRDNDDNARDLQDRVHDLLTGNNVSGVDE